MKYCRCLAGPGWEERNGGERRGGRKGVGWLVGQHDYTKSGEMEEPLNIGAHSFKRADLGTSLNTARFLRSWCKKKSDMFWTLWPWWRYVLFKFMTLWFNLISYEWFRASNSFTMISSTLTSPHNSSWLLSKPPLTYEAFYLYVIKHNYGFFRSTFLYKWIFCASLNL